MCCQLPPHWPPSPCRACCRPHRRRPTVRSSNPSAASSPAPTAMARTRPIRPAPPSIKSPARRCLRHATRVCAAFWTTALAGTRVGGMEGRDGMISQAMRQGGMGAILTVSIVSAAPMVAMFFQGPLGTPDTCQAFQSGGAGASSPPGTPLGYAGSQGYPPTAADTGAQPSYDSSQSSASGCGGTPSLSHPTMARPGPSGPQTDVVYGRSNITPDPR